MCYTYACSDKALLHQPRDVMKENHSIKHYKLIWYGSVRVENGLHTSNHTIATCVQLTTLILHRLSPSIGTTKSFSASSCNRIKQQLTTDCNTPPTSGIYWVQDMQVHFIANRYRPYCGWLLSRFIVTWMNWMVEDGH